MKSASELITEAHQLAKSLPDDQARLVSDIASCFEAARIVHQQELKSAMDTCASIGAIVGPSGTMSLSEQVAAIVAENVAMKDINEWCKTDAFKNMYREFKTAEALGCQDVDCMHDAMLVAIMHAPGIPATDAVIADMRRESWPHLQERDIDALMRFDETCEDNEGYDIGEEAMNRLVELGLCRKEARGVRCITAFGMWVVNCRNGEYDLEPLKTESDRSDEYRAKIEQLRSGKGE